MSSADSRASSRLLKRVTDLLTFHVLWSFLASFVGLRHRGQGSGFRAQQKSTSIARYVDTYFHRCIILPNRSGASGVGLASQDHFCADLSILSSKCFIAVAVVSLICARRHAKGTHDQHNPKPPALNPKPQTLNPKP